MSAERARCVDQGAVVENKRRGAVLSVIQASQAERDQKRLASKKVTLREKKRIEAARIAAGVSESSSPEDVSEVPRSSSDSRRSRKHEPRGATSDPSSATRC